MKVINKPLNKVANNFYEVDMREITLPMIVVTKSSTDFPDKYVARLFDINAPTNVIVVKDSIEEIRDGIPPQFAKFMPSPDDDPVIVECYV